LVLGSDSSLFISTYPLNYSNNTTDSLLNN
jgi:hypothetical protein